MSTPSEKAVNDRLAELDFNIEKLAAELHAARLRYDECILETDLEAALASQQAVAIIEQKIAVLTQARALVEDRRLESQQNDAKPQLKRLRKERDDALKAEAAAMELLHKKAAEFAEAVTATEQAIRSADKANLEVVKLARSVGLPTEKAARPAIHAYQLRLQWDVSGLVQGGMNRLGSLMMGIR